MKIKSKGKVHPSPSSSSSSSPTTLSSSQQVVHSVFQLLPAAILALAAVLSLEDREVLAYMVTRSMKTTTSVSSSPNSSKKSSKKSSSSTNNRKSTSSSSNGNQHHPMFDCECFDCYRSYWFKWDSSPNRELIHQAIEAFEDHLAHGEKPKNGRSKRRDKMGRREAHKSVDISAEDEVFTAAEVNSAAVTAEAEVSALPHLPAVSDDVVAVSLLERVVVKEEEELTVGEEAGEETAEAVVVRAVAVSNHKGLVRKVLPDVLGLFNSRLWSLWSPNA